MDLIRGWQNLRPDHRGCVLTIGNFDGIHLGHQAVLKHLADVGGGVVTHVSMGRPFTEVISYARQQNVGMIIILGSTISTLKFSLKTPMGSSLGSSPACCR